MIGAKSMQIVGIRLPLKIKRKLMKKAKEQATTVSQLVRRLVYDYLGELK